WMRSTRVRGWDGFAGPGPDVLARALEPFGDRRTGAKPIRHRSLLQRERHLGDRFSEAPGRREPAPCPRGQARGELLFAEAAIDRPREVREERSRERRAIALRPASDAERVLDVVPAKEIDETPGPQRLGIELSFAQLFDEWIDRLLLVDHPEDEREDLARLD